MTTRKKSKKAPRSRIQGPKSVVLPSDPPDISVAKARKLPMFGPRIRIPVPLHLLPAYQELYHLVPLTLGEVHDMEKRLGRRKYEDELWVKRVPKVTATSKEL